jgi:hypothetical protein
MRALALLFLAGCAGSIPAPTGDPSRAALFRDLRRIVAVKEATGWQVDRLETDALLGDTLQSVCRTDPETRTTLVAWIDEELVRRGGSARSVFLASGEVRGDLLQLERVRGLLLAAMDSAAKDCPFWLRAERPFRGRQLLDHRFVLVLEGGGKVIGLRDGGRNDLAGGGSGRVLLGRGLGPALLLAIGGELGGSASFPRDEAGERGDLTLGVDLVVPLVVRRYWVNSYLELDAGPLWRFVEDRDTAIGMHLGVAFGVRALRNRWFTPGAALALSYERTFADDTVHLVKIGLRVTFDVGL